MQRKLLASADWLGEASKDGELVKLAFEYLILNASRTGEVIEVRATIAHVMETGGPALVDVVCQPQ